MTSQEHLKPLQLVQKAVRAAVEECRRIQGANFIACIHFGSTAGETIKVETDIDLLMIFNTIPKNSQERFEWSEQFENAAKPFLNELKQSGYHIEFSPLFKTKHDIETRFSVIYLDMLDRSSIVFDSNNAALELLEHTKKWIAKNGSYKVLHGSQSYWVLKPGHNPKESVIDYSWDSAG